MDMFCLAQFLWPTGRQEQAVFLEKAKHKLRVFYWLKYHNRNFSLCPQEILLLYRPKDGGYLSEPGYINN
jgi:hypothetical protein